ncbi:MAG: rhodanese-like domain-containing protein [Methylovulum sp.]|nr:rhodanese-like domain-containing protein [Methylovulum sp.]
MHINSKYCRTCLNIGLVLWLGHAAAAPDTDGIASVTPSEAASMQTAKAAVIVDVREDQEWQDQHIPGAIHIPLRQLKTRLAELNSYKHSAIITQCRSGKRSAQALEVLKSAGFTKAYTMSGGLTGWANEGLATE